MSEHRQSRFRILWVTAVFVLVPPLPRALACLICLPVPTTSPVDYLLEADLVIVAREDPGAPYWLTTTEVLSGDATGLDRSFFLEAPLRPGPSLDRNREVICSYGSYEGLSQPEWARVGDADGDFSALVTKILENREHWQLHPDKRATYFSSRLGHRNQQIRTVAHIEVARAPYDQIRQFEGILPFPELRSSLQNFRLTDWHPLYILLLSLSGQAEDLALISGKVRSAAATGLSLHLAAWVTAWIEMEPEKALTFLTEEYLSGSPRDPAESRAIFRALSVHGNRGHQHLRERITEAYRHILKQHPQMASEVVEDLMIWKQWGLKNSLQPIMMDPSSGLDQGSRLQIAAYLRNAEDISVTAPPDRKTELRRGLLLSVLLLLVAFPAGLSLYRWRAKRARP
ncbi:MAG: hypothetical protein ABGZ31_08015 [Roseibacillus sp.]